MSGARQSSCWGNAYCWVRVIFPASSYPLPTNILLGILSFFRSVVKTNSSFILALTGQIIQLLLFPVHVYSPSIACLACWCPCSGPSPACTASPQPEHMLRRNKIPTVKAKLMSKSPSSRSAPGRSPLSARPVPKGCCRRLCCKTVQWDWSPGGPAASEKEATKV